MDSKVKILILVLIVFVVVDGWLIWKWQSDSIKEEVLIFTDKETYDKEGNLKIVIENDTKTSVCFSSCYPYLLEKNEGVWKAYFYEECKTSNLNKICLEAGKVKAFQIRLNLIKEGLHRIALPACVGCNIGEDFKEVGRFYSNEFIIKSTSE